MTFRKIYDNKLPGNNGITKSLIINFEEWLISRQHQTFFQSGPFSKVLTTIKPSTYFEQVLNLHKNWIQVLLNEGFIEIL